MISKVFAILFAVFGVLLAWTSTYIPAAIFAILYLIFFFIPLKNFETRLIMLAASGLPIILASGNPVFTGIVTLILLLSLLSVTNALSRKTIVFAVVSAVAAWICAFQSTAVVAVIISIVFVILGVYIIFITEYRIRKKLRVNPHERI